MINLLSKDTQKRLRAARRNIMWIRYNLMLVVLIIGLNIGLGVVFFFNYFDQESAQSTLDAAKSQNVREAENIKKRADTFREELDAAKTLLDANISYTDIITTLSNATPNNCSIKSLSVDSAIYKSATKDMDFACTIQGRSIYDVVSTLITDLERSLIYTKVYVKQTVSDPSQSDILQISTSLTTQDPSTKLASALPKGCQLQTINTTQHGDIAPYIALKCRPETSTTTQSTNDVKSELEKRVQKTLEDSCYFDSLKKKSFRFQSFEDYYIAQFVYTFKDLSLKPSVANNSGGEIVCR